MAVEAVATSVGSAGGVGGGMPRIDAGDAASFSQTAGVQPAPGQIHSPQTAAPIQQASLESSVGRSGGPAETGFHRAPPEVSAGPRQSGHSIGRSVIDGVNTMQKGDAAWRSGGPGKSPPTNEPTLKVASREPGPAAAKLQPDASHGPEVAGHPKTQPGKSENPSFDHMVQQLEQVSGQVVQVSIVSKTTGSFTGSLNKLLSSG